jgi:tRNA(adenine34) deaminase
LIKDDRYYLKLAIKEAYKAYELNEIPVGTILVIDDKIISKSHNMRDSSNIVTKHAEIISIEKANKKVNNWRLNNAILYTTLEPCDMCNGVIKEARIKKVVYGAKNKNIKLSNNYFQVDDDGLVEECEKIINLMFEKLRK